MDEYRQYSAVASTIGVRVDFFDSRGGAGALAALCDGRVGGGDCSSGGRLYSAGGFDFCVGEGGQESWGGDYTRTRVVGIERKHGEWVVAVTDKNGDSHEIVCEHVVSASGNFARQTGEMVGLDIR